MHHDLERILQMIYLSHRLKTEGRHCWHYSGRRESVAEHVWCMSFMALLLAPRLAQSVDLEHILKIIIVHDIVEAEAADSPSSNDTLAGCINREMKAQKAIEKICSLLGGSLGDEVRALWREYEGRETFAALFCAALDKLEANLQHLHSPEVTWGEQCRQGLFQIEQFCRLDPILQALNHKIMAAAQRREAEPGLDRIWKMIMLAHKLKTEERHCWYYGGRRESVAEHTWCMSFMALLLAPKLAQKVHMERVLKIIIVHDLVEAEAGDMPFFVSETPEGKAMKVDKEERAMRHIQALLGAPTGDEIRALWEEYEARETFEARFCVALDKLEASIQHVNSPIETWTEKDQQRPFQIDRFCCIDPALAALNQLVVEHSLMKLQEAGLEALAIKQS